MEISKATDRIELPEQQEFAYENCGLLFVGKKIDLDRRKNKYLVNVYKDSKKIGRFTFFVDTSNTIIFEGMFVEPEFRIQGLSKQFIEEIFRIATNSGKDFVHAAPQRKPLMCKVLHGYGFTPYPDGKTSQQLFQETVWVGKSKDGKRIPLYFPCDHKRRGFEKSHIYRSTPYETVRTREEVRDGIRVVLNTDYLRL
jgi:GNAT superfamily N-acetyltransferase